jgi:uncharacterized protein (TIGR03118 family)
MDGHEHKLSERCGEDGLQTTFRQLNLRSNVPFVAKAVDAGLQNPWAILVDPTDGSLWVTNRKLNTMVHYAADGTRIGLDISVSVGGAPTGITFNTATTAYTITNPITLQTMSSYIIGVTDGGYVWGYNPALSATQTFPIDNLVPYADRFYTGVTMLNTLLFAANFRGSVDVYNASGISPSQETTFNNPILPDYGPYNVATINNQVWVAYACNLLPIPVPLFGLGNGYIDIYRADSTFVRRFTSRGSLNTPWAMLSLTQNIVLIGNEGIGQIFAYDYLGTFLGPLKDKFQNPIVNDGLHGVALSSNFLNNSACGCHGGHHNHNYVLYGVSGFNNQGNNKNIDGLLFELVPDGSLKLLPEPPKKKEVKKHSHSHHHHHHDDDSD